MVEMNFIRPHYYFYWLNNGLWDFYLNLVRGSFKIETPWFMFGRSYYD